MNQEMTIVTVENLPDKFKVTEMYQMIQSTYKWKVSQKGLIEALISRNSNEYQEALSTFMALAPREANAIIGTKVSTCTQTFSEGTYMFITHIGTPVRYEEAGQ